MNYSSFQKGSQWRKWDFHVHTPESVLNNSFGSDWDVYVTNLFKQAIAEKIEAIGITDYYTIDGYKKLKQDYLEKPTKLAELFEEDEVEQIMQILVFPNIEFRIDKLVLNSGITDKWNRKVNFHILMSNELTIDEIEQDFLHNLDFEILAGEGPAEQKKKLTRRNLSTFGTELKDQHAKFKEFDDLFVGMMNASVNMGQMQDVLNTQEQTFQGKYVFALPGDEDLSKISWNDGGHSARKVLIQKCHYIMSSNPKTVEFGLGNYHDSSEDFINEFKSIKPCIWGSDCHEFEKMFVPDKNRHCWVKSDLSFDGLKAILYEADSRIKIQEHKPSSKPPYLVIDKVRFTNNANSTFSKTPIHLNDNLTTIIGGKSSGKSLLLYHIAKAIDPVQVAKKSEESLADYNSFIKENPFDMEVIWKDGTTNTLDSSDTKNGQITYIPQLYINQLAERGGKSQLYQLIESILQQNEDYKVFYDSFLIKRDQIKRDIDNNINDLLSFKNQIKGKKEFIQKIGTLQQLTDESKRLKGRIDELTKQSGLSEDQAKEYKDLEDKKRKFDLAIKRANNRVSDLSGKTDNIEREASTFQANLDDIFEETAGEDDKDFQSFLDETKKDFAKELQVVIDKYLQILKSKKDDLNGKIEKGDVELKKIITNLEPYQKRTKNKGILEATQKLFGDNEKKILLLKTSKDELKKLKTSETTTIDRLLTNYNLLKEEYDKVIVKLASNEYKNIGAELTLESKLSFNTEGFSKSFTNLFDKRSKFSQVLNGTFDDSNVFNYTDTQHAGNIKTIFEKLYFAVEPILRMRSGNNEDDKYQKLFDDYFKISYDIMYKGDNMLTMSPGKRGLVLLQLVLHISTATHPILIDQPEDNLDNRTIFYDLNTFIKSKKIERQIILVTHNANLVVSTDAECVIVANQDGQQVGKDNKQYRFEFVSGSLEKTFEDSSQSGVLFSQGIREHVCDILEGGKEAFKNREKKYGFSHLR